MASSRHRHFDAFPSDRWLLSSGVVFLCLGIGSAVAQDSETDNVSPNKSVQERFYEHLAPLGYRSGGTLLYPSVTSSLSYDSNIFADENDLTSDIIGAISADLNTRTDWSRHALNTSTTLTYRGYTSESDESTTDYKLSGNGRLDVTSDFKLSGSALWAQQTEARLANQTPTEADKPVRYTLNALEARATYNFLKSSVDLAATRTEFDFDDVTSTLTGLDIDQQFRDQTIQQLSLRGNYRLRPAIALYGETRLETTSYDAPRPGLNALQDSDGHSVLVGVDFDIKKVARGELEIGYQNRDYKSSVYTDVDGPSLHGEIEYFPTGLTTVSVSADRSIQDTSSVDGSSLYATTWAVGVDHELMRPLMLQARLERRQDDFQNFDRTDNVWKAEAKAIYAVRERIILETALTHHDLDSTGDLSRPTFKETTFSMSMRVLL